MESDLDVILVSKDAVSAKIAAEFVSVIEPELTTTAPVLQAALI